MKDFRSVVYLAAVACALFGGAAPRQSGHVAAFSGTRELLSVDFEPNKPLRYEFVSHRQTTLDFGRSKKDQGPSSTTIEKMELVMSYKPIKVDEFGFAVVEAVCESAKVTRTSSRAAAQPPADAMESANGKSFRIKVTPSGIISDKSELLKLITELGEKAFDRGKRRIKNPDMILDFIATQWFLWDPVSSVERPLKGVAVGDSWNSLLLIPTPVPMKAARETKYTLKEVRTTPEGRFAVIDSEYSLGPQQGPVEWPLPYSGRFQMRGTFGFFHGYSLLNLSGKGTQIFNIDLGRIEEDTQEYELGLSVAMPFALPAEPNGEAIQPNMRIKQQISTKLLE